MANNNILPFCPTDSGTNLLTQTAYAAASDRTNGNQPGVASSKLVNKAIRQATFIASQFAQYISDKTGLDVLDDGNATTLYNTITSALADPLSSNKIQNLGLAASVGASALTLAMKDAAGADPSATSPVKIGFRNATAATGTFSTVNQTAALSLVVPSGATLGQVSAAASYLYVYAIYTGSAIVMGISSTRFDDGSLVSTTLIASGSNTASVMYSAAAQTNKACRLIARLNSTQTTAGTWAAVPTEISLLPFYQAPQYAAFSGSLLGAGGGWTATSTVSYVDPTVATTSTTLTTLQNINFGTVIAEATKLPAITITPKYTGLYRVSVNAAVQNATGLSATWARLVDGSGTVINAGQINVNSTANGSNAFSLDGLVQLTAGVPYTIKVQLQVSASTGAIVQSTPAPINWILNLIQN